ncbi:MAG: peptide chain release factor N(5)-glutamine methyltransferase [Gemmatimonadota bacterium]
MKRAESPSLRETLRGVRGQLESAGIESAGAEAERLVAHVLGLERSKLGLGAAEPFPPGAARDLARLVARRAAGHPLQHLEGTVAFRDLVLRADGRALIPRPETEELVELVARELHARSDASPVRAVLRPGASGSPAGTALDIGAGSGAIALSLVAEGLAHHVLALDVSEEALAQARENLELAGLDPARVELRLSGSDPFEALEADERFDLLVSNPPYVRDGDIDGLPVEVREHEPRVALAGGPDGLDLVRTIAARGVEALRPGGRLFLEIGADHGPEATALFDAAGGWARVARHADLSGRDRFLTARRR